MITPVAREIAMTAGDRAYWRHNENSTGSFAVRPRLTDGRARRRKRFRGEFWGRHALRLDSAWRSFFVRDVAQRRVSHPPRPFCEFYDDSGTRIIPVGISLLYKPPLSEYGGTIYFGAGGGALLIRGQPGPGLPTGTDGMITVAGGLSFGVGTRAGVFVQVRWFRSFEDQTAENEIGVQAGLRFYLSEG